MVVTPWRTEISGLGGASVVKFAMSELEVTSPPKQLLTMLTVYMVLGVRPAKLTEVAVPGSVWVVVAGEVVTVYVVADGLPVKFTVAPVLVRLLTVGLVAASHTGGRISAAMSMILNGDWSLFGTMLRMSVACPLLRSRV